MERQIHSLVQGSAEWLAHRANYWNASDAPAMMGVSPYKTRSELLREKAMGVEKEVDAYTQAIFDDGHRFEALCRPLAEEIIGADLYPVSVTLGKLAASLDGLTMAEDVQWEHKSLNDAIRAAQSAAELPLYLRVQMEHQFRASGAARCLFQASSWDAEGKLIEERHFWYEPDLELQQKVVDGWAQFERDVAAYVPEVIEEKPVGRTPETLPALRLEVTGMVTASNLDAFREHALAVFAGINRELTTDQHFADAEKTVKWCGEVEDRLAAAKQHALSQTASIDELFRTIDDIGAEARRVRLDLDRLVTKRKAEVKESIIAGGRKKFADHCAALISDLGLGDIRLEVAAPDFVGAAKNKRTLASLHDAVDTALAAGKIAADAAARDLRAKLDWYKPHGEAHGFLFRDLQTLIQKASEDFQLAVTTRIEQHKLAEAEKASAKPVEAPAAPTPIAPVARQATRAPAKMARPSDADIIEVLAAHYQVGEGQVITWLLDIDMNRLRDPFAA